MIDKDLGKRTGTGNIHIGDNTGGEASKIPGLIDEILKGEHKDLFEVSRLIEYNEDGSDRYIINWA